MYIYSMEKKEIYTKIWWEGRIGNNDDDGLSIAAQHMLQIYDVPLP